MAACSKYVPRLKKALEYNKLPYPSEIITVMGRRATTDRELDGIINSICNILEPPYCQKSHCPSHTAFGFAGCSKSLVPGKCPLNLTYLKNKKEREEKEINRRIALIPEKFLPLSEESRAKISAMSKEVFEKNISKFK